MAATARQALIADILSKCKDPSKTVAYVPTAGLNAAVDAAGIVRQTGKDGNQEVLGGQSPDILAAAVESALFSAQPQLAKAIFEAERARAVAALQGQSSSYTSAKTATDAQVTSAQGVSFT